MQSAALISGVSRVRPCRLAPAGVSAAAAVALAPASLQLSPCELEHPLRLTVVAAQCGCWPCRRTRRLPPAGRSAARGARAGHQPRKPSGPAVRAGRRPGHGRDHLLCRASPASSRASTATATSCSSTSAAPAAPNPLDCREGEDLLYRASDARDRRRAPRAVSRALQRAPMSPTTPPASRCRTWSACAPRSATQRIDLYGGSYGTRVAQQYLRRYPGTRARAHPRRGRAGRGGARPGHARSMRESALARIFARCAHEAACRAPLRRPGGETTARVRAALAAQPVPVERGRPDERRAAAARVRRRTSWRPCCASSATPAEYAALLPLLLHEARRARDYAPLAAQFLLVERAYGERARASACTTASCAPRTCRSTTRARSTARGWRATFLGTAQLDGLATRVPHLAARPGRCGLARAAHQRGAGAAALGQRRPGDAAALCRARPRAACRTASRRARRLRPRPAHRAVHGPRAWRSSSSARRRAGLDVGCTRQRPPDAVLHLRQRAARP